jgi:sialic acid synthase SpsE
MFDCGRLFSEPDGSPVLVVAEIGINHDGDRKQAERLIDAAADNGADAVKFQVFRTERFYNRELCPGAFELFKGFELSFDDFAGLKRYAESKDLIFVATPLDDESLDFLVDIKTGIIKIASSDITTEPFLEKAAGSGLPVLISTGFVGMNEIERAAAFFPQGKFGLLYCVSKYPADYEDFDLNFISRLKQKFGGVIGFSDHSPDIYLSIAAAGLGAKVVERHFTLDRRLPSADHAMSLEPAEFGRMCEGIRKVEKALGSGEKKITDFENRIRQNSMREMYATRDIRKGEYIQKNDIALMRTGGGVGIERYRKTMDSQSEKDIGVNERI